MLVQLSPWKTTNTSLKVAPPSRRRKRNENETGGLSVEASFVTTASLRVQQKWKRHSAEFSEYQPFLTVTTDHQISVIGKSKEPSYDEFSSLQYSSRPGNVGSFLASPVNGKRTEPLCKIPAILDAKNDRVYGMQHGNTRLCCWRALTSSGPDEKNALRVDLVKPALSMSLLPLHKGVVYGCLADGDIFIAKVSATSDGADYISVEYVQSKEFVEKTSNHLGTFAELPQGQMKTAGSKRKMSDADGHTTTVFFQAFQHNGKIRLVRHEVQFERFISDGTMVVGDSLKQQMASISLASGSDETLESAKLLVSSSGSSPKCAVVYTILRQGSQDLDRFCSLVSLDSGELSHGRVSLARTASQFGMMTETLLLAASQESLILFDLETASTLVTSALPKEIGKDWKLCADTKFGTVAFLYPSGGTLQTAMSTVLLDESPEAALTSKLTLSAKLASSVVDRSAEVASDDHQTPMVVDNLLKLGTDDETANDCSMEEMIQSVLSSLDDARLKVVDSDAEAEDFVFMDTYEGSVATLLTALKFSSTDSEGNGEYHNPQDDLSSNEQGKSNGSKTGDKRTPKKSLNGTHGRLTNIRAMTPSILPQAFIDGTLEIVLKLLKSGKVAFPARARRIALARLDARVILSRLLNTGKVSLRRHFEGTETIRESEGESKLTSTLRSIKLTNKRGRRCFSPVDMIHEMLKKCPDVSERQMVAMLSYMLRRSLPEDSAEIFLEERNIHAYRRHATTARKFFSVRSKELKASLGKSEPSKPSPELEKLSQKMVLAGTGVVLYRIIVYSQCNEAMLRSALQDTLQGHEAVILSRLLSNILASTATDMLSKYPPNLNLVKTTSQWVSGLSDAFQEALTSAETPRGDTYLRSLLRSVTQATKQSQVIMSLQEDVRRAESEIEPTLDAKAAPAVDKFLSPEELPGYSVDRLVF